MKIALQFSGQLRSVKKGYEYYKKNLLDVYPDQVDVFYHTWIPSNDGIYKILVSINETYQTTDQLEEHPLDEEYIKKKYPRVVDPKYPAINTYSMFYSMFQCNMLRKHYEARYGINYDVVIRTRFDYALNRTIDFGAMNPEVLYVPDDRTTHDHDFCSDMFGWGSPKVMDKYHNTFVNLDTFYDIGIPMNGEEMLAANLRLYDLIGQHMDYVNMNNPFPPGPYNFNTHAIIRDDFKEFNQYRK